MQDFKEEINENRYDFLRENEYLKNNILLLAVGGGYAYGTSDESFGSDLDLRGVFGSTRRMLLGMDKTEQINEDITDTVLYSTNKIIELLSKVNPNVIEILGCKPEHYLKISEAGQMLLDNKEIFLSKLASFSFGGYAFDQLSRLKNALANDRISEIEQEKYLAGRLNGMVIHFNNKYTDVSDYGSILFDVDYADKKELCFDINLKGYPVRDFVKIYSEISNCVKDFSKLKHRNNKKDVAHINKHAMHLVRLFYMSIDILSGKGINTYREKDRDILLEIRKGKYYNSGDGSYQSEFFEMVEGLNKELKYAAENTDLPDKPDRKRIEELMMTINELSLKMS